MESKILEKIRLPIKQLDELQGNFKTLGKKQFEKLKGSIKKNGFIQPFFVWKDGHKNYILDGHQRKKAIIDLYGDTIDVDCLEIRAKSILEAKKLCIYYASSYAEFDKESFIDFADGLSFDDVEDFEFPGFKLSEDDFLNSEDNEADDEIPETAQNELGVELGDIYTLGDHRLMCGDSTDLRTVDILMDGHKADMVFTDPPYNQETEGGCKGNIGKSLKKQSAEIESMCDFNPKEFLRNIKTVFKASVMNALVFCNKDLVVDYLYWARENRFSYNILFWKKPNAIPLGGSYRPDVEYLLVFRKNGIFNGGISSALYSKCLEHNRELNKVHPTMKPVEMIENQIIICSNQNNLIVDFFGGSGSTLIACEKTKRKCYMMELDPHYCSVIIKRWEKFTGQKAVKCA